MIGWLLVAGLLSAPPSSDSTRRDPALVPVPGGGPLLHRVALLPAAALTTVGPGGPLPQDGTIELQAVLSSADRAFPLIVAATADVVAAEAEALAANGAFDPSLRARGFVTPQQLGPYPQVRLDSTVESVIPNTPLTAFAGYRLGVPLSTSGIQPYYQERETFPAGELRAGLSAPLLRNLWIDRRRASLQRAELGRDVAKQGQAVQRIDVARLAAFRYWDWVAAGMRRQVARDLLRIAKDRDRQLAVRVKTGDVPFFDQLDNQRAVAQRESFAVQTQRAVEQASFELSLYLRGDDGAPQQPSDERMPPRLPEPDATSGAGADIDEALARRPDVQRLLLQQRQQQVEVSLQKNQLLPALDLGATFGQDLGNASSTVDKKLGTPEFEFAALFEVPLVFRLPLGRLRAAEASLAKIEAQLRLARDRVSVEVKDALSALSAARERVKFTRQEVEVAQKLQAGERQRFELGDSNLLFVNLRETQSAEARLREIDALLDYHRAVASFRAAMAL